MAISYLTKKGSIIKIVLQTFPFLSDIYSIAITGDACLLLGATNKLSTQRPGSPKNTTQHQDVSFQSTLDRRPMYYLQNGPVESECKLNNVNWHIIRNQYQIQNQREVTLNEDRYCKSCHYQTNTEFYYSIQISSESPMEYSRRPTKSIPKENQLKILNKISNLFGVHNTYKAADIDSGIPRVMHKRLIRLPLLQMPRILDPSMTMYIRSIQNHRVVSIQIRVCCFHKAIAFETYIAYFFKNGPFLLYIYI